MDAKEAFDEIRARFAARPLFPEVELKLIEMRRRVETSLRQQGGSYISDMTEVSDAQQRSSTSLMRKLPPPIVRPAAVEALMHHVAPLPVRKEAEKYEKGGVALVHSDGGGDMKDSRTEDYWSQRHLTHLYASGRRVFHASRGSFNFTPVASFPSGAGLDQTPDAGTRLPNSDMSTGYYTPGTGGVRSPRGTLGLNRNIFSLLNSSSGASMKQWNERGDERPGALLTPLSLYDGTNVERVRRAVQNNVFEQETKREAQKQGEEKVCE
ncbi:hypothetical protein TraAM80_03073 [Trypanosoma rangeli]|uniref:Uncharacterized protein n=1 Tax=Trypanosoma rangeli TaxID=5698 RepID=A0A422NR42_TRYRA|nr:uncharacterized protein TraAM80_03073 [Trypanosoma rangeli]RNF07925.1 hypothetical protein TraAM80_03073 [Trypanosoma rangeli]|eukprot:RNF07925.1 hypothetical protein TraAM80_03073 [Trypanosoma rangeli]